MDRRTLLAALSGAFASACTPLGLLNSVAPRDQATTGPFGVAYGSDPRQRFDVYRPWGSPPQPPPLLVFFYGGAWRSGNRADYGWLGQALASRGFLTVLPDHRLVPEVRYPAFVEDGAAAVAKAREMAESLGGDPDRVLLAGHSSGAYVAAMLALQAKWLRAAGAEPAAVKAFVGLSGPFDFFPFDVKSSIEAFGQAPDPRATQPVNLDLAEAPPTLLLHGGRDQTVRQRNSEALAAALRSAGREVELKLYPALDHKDVVLALARPFRDKAPVLDDMTRFLQAHAS